MKILGIDTATKFLSLGILDGTRICEFNLEVERKLSSLIAASIKRASEAAGMTLDDFDYFACGIGPGSFTGMRVGLATVKGLCWSLKKPIIGISTLDTLAQNIKFQDDFILPVLDARRGLVYAGIYQAKGGVVRRQTSYLLLSPQELCKKINRINPRARQVKILGDAINLYQGVLLEGIKGARILEKDYWYPKGHNIVELARDRVNNKKIDNLFKLKPIYLYPKECQIRR